VPKHRSQYTFRSDFAHDLIIFVGNQKISRTIKSNVTRIPKLPMPSANPKVGWPKSKMERRNKSFEPKKIHNFFGSWWFK
jgi:hypothetical protein